MIHLTGNSDSDSRMPFHCQETCFTVSSSFVIDKAKASKVSLKGTSNSNAIHGFKECNRNSNGREEIDDAGRGVLRVPRIFPPSGVSGLSNDGKPFGQRCFVGEKHAWFAAGRSTWVKGV